MVKIRHSIGTIAEHADTDALPIAATHRETVASRDEVLTIDAVIELMAVVLAVVRDSEVDGSRNFRMGYNSCVNDLPLAVGLDEDALRTDADATEQLTRTEESCIAVARGGEQCGALALVSNDLLR